jgi:hypothetical protein
MDELVNLVAQKAGITQDQARTAVTVVLDFLKQKLPAPVAGQLDALMSGQGGNAAGIGSAVEGLFGKK